MKWKEENEDEEVSSKGIKIIFFIIMNELWIILIGRWDINF